MFLLAGLAVMAASCNSEPTCAEVHAHMMTIFPAAMQKAAGSDDSALKQRSIDRCKQQIMPAGKKCIMAAADMGGIMSCAQEYPAKEPVEEAVGP